MPPITIPGGVLPSAPVWLNVRAVQAGRTYLLVLSTTVSWPQPPGPRPIAIALDADGFDAAGNIVDWDSGLSLRIDDVDDGTALFPRSRPVSVNQLVTIPPGVESVRLMAYDQVGEQSGVPFPMDAVAYSAITGSIDLQ